METVTIYMIFLYVCASYNGVCIDTFVYLITVSVLSWLCMLYNITAGYTSSWYFVLYLSSAYFIPPLRHGYICVCVNMFVNVISMVTAICLCNSYNPLLGWAKSWELCHAYLLYIICHSIVFTLVDLHSQNCINTLLF